MTDFPIKFPGFGNQEKPLLPEVGSIMYHVRKPKIAMLVEATISALNQEQGVGFDREAPVSNVIPIEAAGRDSLRKAGAGLVESAAQTDHIDQARNQVEDSYEFRDAA